MSKLSGKLMVLLVVLTAFSVALPARSDDLGLSSQQKRQLKELSQDLKQQTGTLRQKLRTEREELWRLYSNYKLDEPKVRGQIRKVNDVQYSLLTAGLDNQVKLRQIVSEQQFYILEQREKDQVRKLKDGRHRGETGRGHKHMEGVERALDQAGVTSAQKAKLRDLYHETDRPHTQLMDGLKAAAQDVERLYSSYRLDRNKARLALRKLNRAQLEMMLSHLEQQKELRTILTSDQFTAVHDRIMHERGEH